jgi:thiamine-phosphate pyrophosphorylase
MSPRRRLDNARLYFVVDARPHGTDPEPLLEAALRGGVDIVQLREKDADDETVLAAASTFRALCDRYGALFILNDRPDLAVRANADGVHLGQDDMPVEEARAIVGEELLVGLSTHSPEQIQAAARVDYIGVGTIFGTPTKPRNAAAGLDLVRAAARLATLPWFAIGGIDPGNVGEVAAAGAARVAVVRAIRDASAPEAAVRALRAALGDRAGG